MKQKFKCKWCPKSFDSARGLTGHKKAHKDEPDYVAGAGSTVQSPLLTIAGSPYECGTCHSQFGTKKGLKIHTASHGRIRKHKTRTVDAALFDPRNAEAIADEDVDRRGVPPPSAVSLNYCPCCGVNLQTIEAAMVAALG